MVTKVSIAGICSHWKYDFCGIPHYSQLRIVPKGGMEVVRKTVVMCPTMFTGCK